MTGIKVPTGKFRKELKNETNGSQESRGPNTNSQKQKEIEERVEKFIGRGSEEVFNEFINLKTQRGLKFKKDLLSKLESININQLEKTDESIDDLFYEIQKGLISHELETVKIAETESRGQSSLNNTTIGFLDHLKNQLDDKNEEHKQALDNVESLLDQIDESEAELENLILEYKERQKKPQRDANGDLTREEFDRLDSIIKYISELEKEINENQKSCQKYVVDIAESKNEIDKLNERIRMARSEIDKNFSLVANHINLAMMKSVEKRLLSLFDDDNHLKRDSVLGNSKLSKLNVATFFQMVFFNFEDCIDKPYFKEIQFELKALKGFLQTKGGNKIDVNILKSEIETHSYLYPKLNSILKDRLSEEVSDDVLYGYSPSDDNELPYPCIEAYNMKYYECVNSSDSENNVNTFLDKIMTSPDEKKCLEFFKNNKGYESIFLVGENDTKVDGNYIKNDEHNQCNFYIGAQYINYSQNIVTLESRQDHVEITSKRLGHEIKVLKNELDSNSKSSIKALIELARNEGELEDICEDYKECFEKKMKDASSLLSQIQDVFLSFYLKIKEESQKRQKEYYKKLIQSLKGVLVSPDTSSFKFVLAMLSKTILRHTGYSGAFLHPVTNSDADADSDNSFNNIIDEPEQLNEFKRCFVTESNLQLYIYSNLFESGDSKYSYNFVEAFSAEDSLALFALDCIL